MLLPHLDWSPAVVNPADWTGFGKAHSCLWSHEVQGITGGTRLVLSSPGDTSYFWVSLNNGRDSGNNRSGTTPFSFRSSNVESNWEGKNVWLLHNGPTVEGRGCNHFWNRINAVDGGRITGFEVSFKNGGRKGEIVRGTSEAVWQERDWFSTSLTHFHTSSWVIWCTCCLIVECERRQA